MINKIKDYFKDFIFKSKTKIDVDTDFYEEFDFYLIDFEKE